MNSYKSKSNILFVIAVLLVVMLYVVGKMQLYINAEKEKQQNQNEERKLVFEIQSKRINCSTVWLEVYNDNTYEYFYTYGDENNIEPLVGRYDYNVKKIIENNNKYINSRKPYSLIYEDGITYDIYDNNVELNEFLDSINIKLDTCLVSNNN